MLWFIHYQWDEIWSYQNISWSVTGLSISWDINKIEIKDYIGSSNLIWVITSDDLIK